MHLNQSWAALALLLLACGPLNQHYAMDKARNTERYATVMRVQSEDSKIYPQLHVCQEPVTGAVTLNALNLALEGEGGNEAAKGKGKVSLANTQSLGQLFTVTEIMQLAHMGIYRLCEARGNGDITTAEYKELYSKTFDQTTHLLNLQLQLTKENRIAVAQAQLEMLRAELEGLRKKAAELEKTKTNTEKEARDLATAAQKDPAKAMMLGLKAETLRDLEKELAALHKSEWETREAAASLQQSLVAPTAPLSP